MVRSLRFRLYGVYRVYRGWGLGFTGVGFKDVGFRVIFICGNGSLAAWSWGACAAGAPMAWQGCLVDGEDLGFRVYYLVDGGDSRPVGQTFLETIPTPKHAPCP